MATNQVLISIQAELGDLATQMRKMRGLVTETTSATKAGFDGLQGQFESLTASYIKFTASWEAAKRAAQAVQTAFAPSVEFEAAMLRVRTLVDVTDEQFNALATSVESLASRVPQSATQLADGLYQTISSGVTDTGQALSVLEVGAKAAVGGITDAFTAVDVITTILNSYGLAASDAGRVSDLLFQTVKDGKTTFEELAPVLGRVTPIASNLGVSLEELSAAIATLTIGGIRSEQAVTGVLSFLRSLSTVSADGKAYAESLGLQWDTSIVKTKGLVGAIKELRDATGGNAEAIKALVNDSEGWIAALALTGKGYDTLTQEVQKMSGAAGEADRAFGIMSSSAQNQLSSIGNSLAQLSRDLFDRLLPVLTTLAGAMSSLAGNFNTLYAAAKPVVAILLTLGAAQAITALPAVLSGVTGAVVALRTAFWGLAASQAAATGGLSAVAAAAGVAAIAAMAVYFGGVGGEADDAAASIGSVGPAANTAAGGLKAYGAAAANAAPGIGFLLDSTKSFQQLLDEVKEKQAAALAATKAAAQEKAALATAEVNWQIAEWDRQQTREEEMQRRWTESERKAEDNRAALRRKAVDEQQALIEAAITADMARWERQVENLTTLLENLATAFGDTITGSLTDGMDGLRAGLKQMLLTIVAAIEQLVLAAKIKALAEAIVAAKFNPALTLAALATSLPAIVGLEALFAGLRGGISKFEHGGVIDRPTMALMGEAVHRSGPEIVAPRTGFRRELRSWADEVLLPVVQGSGSGLADEDRGLLREIRDALNPSRFGSAAGRSMGRELALAGRSRL